MKSLRLTIAGFGDVIVDIANAIAVRVEDASGRFGILPGHADFLTALDIGVVSWRDVAGHESHCAVRGGVLTVSGGTMVAVATREAIADDDLERLESTVLREFRERENAERSARVESTRMELRAVREILRYLRPGRGDGL